MGRQDASDADLDIVRMRPDAVPQLLAGLRAATLYEGYVTDSQGTPDANPFRPDRPLVERPLDIL